MLNDDIGECLTSLGIEKRHIMPTNIARTELNQFRNEINIFPLRWFDEGDDDGDFFREASEGRFAQRQVFIAQQTSFHFLCCVTNDLPFFVSCLLKGFAFLPDSSSLEISDEFEWRKVTVVKRNETTNKWRVRRLESSAVYEVPRIYLMFIAESPIAFAERVKRAQQLRNECEAKLRFEAVVDKVQLSEISKPPQHLRDVIRAPLMTRFKQGWIEMFEWEHCMMYQKTIAAMELIRLSEDDFPSTQLPSTRRAKSLETTNKGSLKTMLRRFQLTSFYCCPEAIKIMEFVNNECDDVSRMSLFHHQTDDACSLMGFVNVNHETLSTMADFLQRKWIEKLMHEVRRQLANVKGWLDLNINDWHIYRMSKLSRLIELIRRRMEMTVRVMVRSSLEAFVNHLCEPMDSIFLVELHFDDHHEPAYTENVEGFGTTLVNMLESSILTTHEIPQIDPYLVTQMKFEKGLRLSSVGLLDDDVQEQIRRVRRCYEEVLAPLRAFAEKFRPFKDFKALIIPDYVRSLNDKTSDEMKDEISRQLKAIDEIELSVPATIVIGPFRVNVANLKSDLIVKRRDLYDRLLTTFIDGVKAKLDEVSKFYNETVAKLTKKFESVEELVTVRDWIPNIPAEVKRVEMQMKKLAHDFDILESFKVLAPDGIVRTRIVCQTMPTTIQQTIEDTQAKRNFDFEQFRKLQATHEVQFYERIATLASDVDSITAQRDFDEISRIASDIDNLWSVLSELVTRGELLNHRQQLFNQPEIDMERLNVTVDRLHPHHELWTMAANFLQSKAKWTLEPLSSIDVDVVGADVKRCENVLQDSRLRFASDAEMMVLIGKISSLVDNAQKALDVIRDVVGFEIDHWAILEALTGIIFMYSPTTSTFDSLLVRGIMKNADVVKQVWMKATRELEARNLEEIEAERKRLQEAEINEQKKARRADRKDI